MGKKKKKCREWREKKQTKVGNRLNPFEQLLASGAGVGMAAEGSMQGFATEMNPPWNRKDRAYKWLSEIIQIFHWKKISSALVHS